jgi:hypothetical protein
MTNFMGLLWRTYFGFLWVIRCYFFSGLWFIRETLGKPHQQFYCELCELSGSTKIMAQHIVGIKHRLTYLVSMKCFSFFVGCVVCVCVLCLKGDSFGKNDRAPPPLQSTSPQTPSDTFVLSSNYKIKLVLLYSVHIHPKKADGAGRIHPNVSRPSMPRV